jgi:DNA-binding winged helix-turn-helix (wHTH) protein/Tol biopolymer transport system component
LEMANGNKNGTFTNGHRYAFDNFEIDAPNRMLLRDGQPVALTGKLFDVLLVFAENPGRLLEKDELLQKVWGSDFVEEGNLARNVSSLRKALGDTGREHKYIATVQGHGYRFLAETSTVPVREVRRPDANGAEPAGSRRWILLAATLVLAAFAVFGLAFLNFPNRRTSDVSAQPLTFRRLTSSGTVTKLALSPDGNLIAFASGDNNGTKLVVRQTGVSNEITLTTVKGLISSISFSPDSKLIFYSVFRGDSSEGELYSIPILGGVSRSYPGLAVTDFAFAPDGFHFAGVNTSRDRGESVLVVDDLANTNERELIKRKLPTDFNAEDHKVAWAPNGSSILIVVNEKTEASHFASLIAVDPETGAENPLTTFHWAHIDSVQWRSDSQNVIVAGNESKGEPVQLFNVALDGTVRKLTNDVNNYSLAAANAHDRSIVALQAMRSSGIWNGLPERGYAASDELIAESGTIAPLAFSGNEIVFRANGIGGPDLWSVPIRGGEKHPITQDAKVDFRGICAMPDGTVVFSSDKGGTNNIWRRDAASGTLSQLTFGDSEIYPACTPDGRWVIFQRMATANQKTSLWKVGINGGEPERLTDFLAVRPAVSPDGQWISVFYMDDPTWKIGLVSIGGGKIEKSFDLPVGMTDRIARWSPDGKSLLLVGNSGEIGNVWRLPLDGTPASRITDFEQQNIEDMIISPTGNVVLSRSTTISDVFIASDR